MKTSIILKNNAYIIFFIIFLVTSCRNDVSSCGTPGAKPSPTGVIFEVKTIKVKDKSLSIEIADTDYKRQLGLMYRTKLDENKGMLFIFTDIETHSFWMKNTLIPLTIAFIDANKVITQIEDMEPETEVPHTSKFKVKYALEVNKGWFEKNNIKPGDRLSF
jgi:hypothetical protein